MPVLNDASAVQAGALAAQSVSVGGQEVWTPGGPTTPGFFGTKLTNGGGNWGIGANRAMLDRFPLVHTAHLTGLFQYFLAGVTAGGSIKGIICADNGGVPGDVLVVGDAVAVPAGGPFYVQSPMTGILLPGNYWIGAVSNGGGSGDMGSGAHSAPQAVIINGDFSYASPPATCPAPAAQYNNDLGCYVEYLYQA